MRSLRSRLTVGLLLTLAAVFAAQWLIVRQAVPHMIDALITKELTEDADELFAAMNLAGTQALQLYQIDPRFVALHSEHQYEVMIGQGRVFASPALADKGLGATTLPRGATLQRRVDGPAGRQLLVLSKGYEDQARAVTISVGIDMQSVNRRMNEFLRRYGLLSAAMLACLMLLQAWIVRHSLSVLGRVHAELALVGQGGAHTVDEHVPSEIAPLVREINHLSRAMAQRLQRSRQALGNLAHALKTPLTVLSQLAQDSFNDRPNIAQALEHQVRTLRRRVDLELKRARLAGHGGMAQRVDLCEEMRALTHTIAQIHGTKHLDIVCDAPPAVHFHGDREDMLELFGNLLDNACKYANKTVLISVRSEVGVRATFEDDGPGCAPEHFELLTQRGVRLDESVHGDGLGLAIVADIVESYRGKVEFSRSERLGGLCASVWLPLGRAPA